jgi:hypothetical protein
MDERERRRDKRRRKAGKKYTTWDLGNGMEQATPEAVFGPWAVPPDLDWRVLAQPDRSCPVAGPCRRWQRRSGALPPGIPTGFDRHRPGTVVGTSLLDSCRSGPRTWWHWPEPREWLGTVRPRSRGAVDRRCAVRVLQSGVGCASALVLAPDELERIFGDEPQCLIAPMRDLLISLPAETDRTFVAWLNDEFAEMDPNGLALDAFVVDASGLRYETLRRPVAV